MTQGITTLIRESARRLRSARSATGLTLSQLSERTGGLRSKSRISNYEQGIRRISVEAPRGACSGGRSGFTQAVSPGEPLKW